MRNKKVDKIPEIGVGYQYISKVNISLSEYQ